VAQSVLQAVRTELLAEARRSPQLLSDLAGLEQYIAESYNSRSFAELLQNADDVSASRFLIKRSGAYLLVANDGRAFTFSDFESLCRSAASNKERGVSIGYRGIGFKSVVGLAQKVYLYSGELAAVFSREKTAWEVPEAKRVPLVRIPHPVDPDESSPFRRDMDHITSDGYRTVFVFAELLASSIESEFADFDATALLFLRNIRRMELHTHVDELTTVRRELLNATTQRVGLSSAAGTRWWTIICHDDVALAIAQDESGVERLSEQEAVVHAFLPTHEATGLAIKVNGDVSTDPSRTRVVLDDRTKSVTAKLARLVADVLLGEIATQGQQPISSLTSALVSRTDPRALVLQRRSFKTEFVQAIQVAAKSKLQGLYSRPGWLNAADFASLAEASGLTIINPAFESITGFTAFVRYLGAPEADLGSLSSGLRSGRCSPVGCSDVVARLVMLFGTGQISARQIHPDWRIWMASGHPVSVGEAAAAGHPLDGRFVEMILEHGAGEQDLRRLLSAQMAPKAVDVLLPPQGPSRVPGSRAEGGDAWTRLSIPGLDPPASAGSHAGGSSSRPLSLRRWRSAEQQVWSLLVAMGAQVSDVSGQNIGYDLEARTPSNQTYAVEVKSIDYPGQPFTLTGNEEVVARQRQGDYLLAIVCQKQDSVEVAFIRDPASQLSLVRQCRQWVWECADYEFAPERFPVSD